MKIDLIIPCYKAHDKLPRLLGSIISQTIVEDLEVTLVNDGDTKNYKDIVDIFSNFISIKEIVLEQNGGPAVARQYGYDNTFNPLVMFIDADDTLAGAFSLKVLRQQILTEPENVICVGSFLEEQENHYINHEQDTVWMFGKLYKREFLDKHNIRFNNTRANEDTGFNMLCKLMTSNIEKIKFIKDIVYYWHSNPNSITRINNCEYSYNQSFVGYTDNMIWALKEAEKRNPFNGNILYQKVCILLNLYEYFIETPERDARFIEQNWGCCKKYFHEIYKEIKDKISDDILKQVYSEIMRNAYLGNKLRDIIPIMDIYEFLENLEKEDFKPCNIMEN